MSKTPDYTRKAVKKYSDKFDQVTLLLPKGTKERIRLLQSIPETSVNSYINNLVNQDMRKRRKEIMSMVSDKIRKDIAGCKTLEDWKEAYDKLLENFKDTVNGERSFEDYVAQALGVEALRKFSSNIREPLYSDKEIKLAEARSDFGFLGKDMEPDVDEEDKIQSARAYYFYLSHMFLAATSRCNKIEENITNVLGSEAFERLASQGHYERDKMWAAISAALPDGAERTKLFLDYMTDSGLFEGREKELEPLTLGDEWTEIKDGLPEKTGFYTVLLHDLSEKGVLYWKEKGHWIQGHMEWSPLIFAWKEGQPGQYPEVTEGDIKDNGVSIK